MKEPKEPKYRQTRKNSVSALANMLPDFLGGKVAKQLHERREALRSSQTAGKKRRKKRDD